MEPRFQGQDATVELVDCQSGEVTPVHRAQSVFNKHNKLAEMKTVRGRTWLALIALDNLQKLSKNSITGGSWGRAQWTPSVRLNSTSPKIWTLPRLLFSKWFLPSLHLLKVLQMSDTALKTRSEKLTLTFMCFMLGSWRRRSLCCGVKSSLASAWMPYLSNVQWVFNSHVFFFSHHRAWSDQSFFTSEERKTKIQWISFNKNCRDENKNRNTSYLITRQWLHP